MENRKSIKRHEALKSFSREHHTALMLCWNIKIGLKKNIECDRIQNYIDHLWKDHIEKHFDDEERLLFPLLGEKHELTIRTREDHKILRSLFTDKNCNKDTISEIGERLEAHIRFEERILFKMIQEKATESELETLTSKS